MRRRLPTLGLATVLVTGAPAQAGILVDARLEGVPLRLELGSDPNRVLVTVDGRTQLVDLAAGKIWPGGAAAPASSEAGTPEGIFQLERWSRGPAVAGYASQYGVLRHGEAICAEVLSSPWMKSFLEPLVRALALLQRVDAALRPKPRPGCGALPFDAYAGDGWPLLVGFRDVAIFRTLRLRFDHEVDADRLAAVGGPSATRPP